MRLHRERKAKATIVLTPVENPTAYGLVETESDGRVRRFVEKPRRLEPNREAILILSLIGKQGNPKAAARPRAALLPWFIIGFAGLAALRALGWVPAPLVAPAAEASHMLTLLSMAGLGLSVDISGLRQAGYRTIAAASLSLLALVGMSLGLLSLVARYSG